MTASADRPTIVAVVGPTASGKTLLGIELALRLGGEVVSADARQVYRGMDIGTAKPTADERRRVPHHFIDILDPPEEYNAGRYGQEARETILRLHERHQVPIVVGGSGLYVRSALDGLFDGPGSSPELRARLEQMWRESGEEGLRAALRAVDPETERLTEWGKPRRLIRALEVYEVSGIPLSEHHRRQTREAPFRVVMIGLAPERSRLYRRINRRVVEMMERGLVQEVRALRSRGFGPELNAMNTVGYREVFELLEGKVDERSMVESIQTHSRQYAKRQMTWFRGDHRIVWFERSGDEDREALIAEVVEMFESRRH